MNIPLLANWFKKRDNRKLVEKAIQLSQRKARIIVYKRKYGIKDVK